VPRLACLSLHPGMDLPLYDALLHLDLQQWMTSGELHLAQAQAMGILPVRRHLFAIDCGSFHLAAKPYGAECSTGS